MNIAWIIGIMILAYGAFVAIIIIIMRMGRPKIEIDLQDFFEKSMDNKLKKKDFKLWK